MLFYRVSSTLLIWAVISGGALLLILSFLAGAEAAILAANRIRAKHQSELGAKGAKALVQLHLNKENFLPALLAAETLVTVAISTLGTAVMGILSPTPQALFIEALLITGLVLIIGEIIPKTIATNNPDKFAYFAAPTILVITKFLEFFLRPVTWTLRQLFKLTDREASHHIPTEKELKYLISLSQEHGVLQKEEEELLQNIFEFTDAKVGEIMIPRTQVKSVEADATVDEVLQKFAETRFSRFPVHAKDLDHVLGFLDIRDILPALTKKGNTLDLRTFIRPAVFVPESKRVGTLLHEMKREHFHLAIVIDEYGGTAGMVSLTNLLEEIVGKLEVKAVPEEPSLVNEETLIVSASTKLEEIDEKLGTTLQNEEYHTIGGLVFGLFGRVPEQGEQVRHQNLRFTVTEKDGYKISKVMIARDKTPQEER